jgi:hypothetical protein
MNTDISKEARAERRRYRRKQTSLIATVNYNFQMLPCFIADISVGGAKIKLLEPTALPAGPLELECGRFGKVAAELVWQKGLFAGLKFADPAAFGELVRQVRASSAGQTGSGQAGSGQAGSGQAGAGLAGEIAMPDPAPMPDPASHAPRRDRMLETTA